MSIDAYQGHLSCAFSRDFSVWPLAFQNIHRKSQAARLDQKRGCHKVAAVLVTADSLVVLEDLGASLPR